MKVSAVIITRNEAPRLRLVLESFAGQDLEGEAGASPTELEVVVVDDGSTDETPAVLAQTSALGGALRVVRHSQSRGRSPSRNHGVEAASGEVVVLFDGDCLAAPRLVARHGAIHAQKGRMGRGETYHLRSTRFFLDPEVGSPMPGQEEHVRRMGPTLGDALVTRTQVRHDFASIFARGEPGIYAGAGPRQLYELEMRALHARPEASILWMTAPGQNFSMRREDFLAVGGFDERLSMNEHRELAYRLHQRGVRMVPVDGARSFHMLHRVGWRDPLAETDWEQIFYRSNPCFATKLMNVFWLSLARDKDLPPEARINSLEQLEDIVRNGTTVDYDEIRRGHPRLAPLD